MKKVLSVLVAAVMLAALCVPAFAAGEAVTLNADKTEAAIGDTVTVTVDVAKLSGLEATVNYDTDAFELVSATASDLMLGQVNDGTAGAVKYAGAAADVKDGTVLTVVLKYKGGEGAITLDVADAVDADDNSLALTAAALAITEATTTTTTTTVATTAPTTAATTAAKTTVKNPTTGSSVSVAASAAAVVVMAVAVAYTMKKKDEE